jgi:hypothetical protein
MRGEAGGITAGVGDSLPLEKDIFVRVAPPSREGGRTMVPIRVEAAGASSLVPRLEADLELAPVESQLTQLTLSGSYRPSLGFVGELVDRALLHRLTEGQSRAWKTRWPRP